MAFWVLLLAPMLVEVAILPLWPPPCFAVIPLWFNLMIGDSYRSNLFYLALLTLVGWDCDGVNEVFGGL